jgi:hypothetical protein
VSSLSEIYRQLCTEDRFPSPDVTDPKRRLQRQNNLKTSLRYLAEAHGSTPDRLPLTPEVEDSYNLRLRDYLKAQGKGHSTVRNTINDIGQFLRIYRQLPKTTRLPQLKGRPKLTLAAMKGLNTDSPYAHWRWLIQSPYYLRRAQWPTEVEAQFKKYEGIRHDQIRASTMKMQVAAIEAYLGYLGMDGERRLTFLAPESRAKLETKPYRDDLQLITSTPQTLAWNDLFVVDHLKSFVVWQSWRIHTPEDAFVLERAPSKLSAKAKVVGETMLRLAQHLPRKRDIKPIAEYLKHLPEPRKIHNKRADYHRLSWEDLEAVAHKLMDEARGMMIVDHNGVETYKHPGSWPASRFATGLVLMLGWRTPIRIRNWSEALIGKNLRQEDGTWHWHFEGEELKVGERIYDVEIPPEVAPYLEEYLTVWRPKLPRADTDRHLLLSGKPPYGALRRNALHMKLRLHVFRLTGKRFYPHLLRSIFYSHAVARGVDVNTAAYYLGDTAKTAFMYYNEFMPEEHKKVMHAVFRQVGHGNGHSSGKA